ncbi:MAG: GGDEF domain-containing protein [Treponema sp.]|uniref:GGDEF domain-containing protein n=1 Tax=Treponema sp. TaxID=166 RepID=UPI001B4ECB71|nr:GGDEF domain-containing protein [Treponema sp.]MBP3773023.1 GGDEF domain-containing protein [Treponema sp.]MBQ9281719.1 GGDEF domain-containing protein [Treponema sp.]
MTIRSFNFYGFSKDSYMECADLIHSTNRKHITILNTWFLFINLLYLIFSILNLFGVNQERIPYYALYIVIALAFEFWLVLFPKKVETHNYFAVFCSIAILLSYGVLSSVAEPYMPATIFLILLTLTSLSFIGNMLTFLLLTFFWMGLFIATSYLYKTFSIAYYDTYNVVVVATLVICLHYTFQKTRVAQFILYQRDLQIQKELEIKSSFDSLTSLLNRGKFFSITETALRLHSPDNKMLCLLDLDGFKQINDSLGHQMGDKVIQIVGRTILEVLELNKVDYTTISKWDLSVPKSLAGRLGGDEFIIFLRGLNSQAEVKDLLQKLLDALNAVSLDGLSGIQASLGVTTITEFDKDIDNAYKRADEALYESKRAGKNQIHFNLNQVSGDA